jgi:DNA-binding PadR family transcriptional regulator
MSRKPTQQYEHWKCVSHIRTPLAVLDSPAWRVLAFSDKALYGDLRAKVRSANNGNINATHSEMKHRGWTSSATLWKSLRHLERMGLIARTRQGGIGGMSKICNLYRFTDLPVHDHAKQRITAGKPTNDFLAFDSVKAAQSEIDALKREIQCEKDLRRKSKVQKLKLVASRIE